MTRLPSGQLWGLIIIIVGLITGAFGIGSAVRGTLEEAQTGQIMAEKRALELRAESLEQGKKTDGEQMRQQEVRANFLTVYLRYFLARDGLDQHIPLDAARKALDDYIEGRVERGNITIHKGQGRHATVELPNGHIWIIPPALRATSSP